MTDDQSRPFEQIRVSQETETPLTALSQPPGTVLYLYARSVDSVQSDSVGQDYVTFRYGPTDIAFAVCDGVGQSFMGDLAARILGEGLVTWLWSMDRPKDEEKFQEQITGALNELTVRSGKEVAEYKLPDSLPPILKQALELQRDYGSESMFVAGRLALGGSEPWLSLAWLGDAPVAAIDIDGELVDLGPKGHTSERWNATTGVKGEVHTWVTSAKKVARVAGYTDGLATGDVPTDSDLAKMMELWKTDPPIDDASLFDVRLAHSPQTVGKEPSPETKQKMLLLPSGDPTRGEPEFFTQKADAEQTDPDTRPITVEDPPRTPVAGVDRIEAPPTGGAVGEWRPLTEKPLKQPRPSRPALPAPADMLAGLDREQQAAVWQQAALMGLTSAALALMMLERLLFEEGEQKSD